MCFPCSFYWGLSARAGIGHCGKQKEDREPESVVHASNPSMQEVEVGRLRWKASLGHTVRSCWKTRWLAGREWGGRIGTTIRIIPQHPCTTET